MLQDTSKASRLLLGLYRHLQKRLVSKMKKCDYGDRLAADSYSKEMLRTQLKESQKRERTLMENFEAERELFEREQVEPRAENGAPHAHLARAAAVRADATLLTTQQQAGRRTL